MFTTNSTTSSNEESIRHVLINYLEGKYSFMELQNRLNGYVAINFNGFIKQREIQCFDVPENIKIQVDSGDLRRMLQKYLDKNLSAEDLSCWAAFIYMMPFYLPEGETEDERWQSGESELWKIIQKLADPNNISSLDFNVVEGYLALL